MTKFNVTKIALVSAITLMSTVSIFAGYLEFNSTVGSRHSMTWGLNDEKVTFGKVFKYATVNSSDLNKNIYIVIYSAGGGGSIDPSLCYTPNGYYETLCNDYNGTLNFGVVIHFNGCKWPGGLSLGYTHSESKDVGTYYVGHELYDLDPGLHNIYYLEVYPDNTTQKIWHP